MAHARYTPSNTHFMRSEFTLTAYPPEPPNWEESCDLALQGMSPFTKIHIPPISEEYAVIADLLSSSNSCQIKQIERVVNVELWKKFILTRKELLSAKSTDLNLCKELGLSEKEILQKAHSSMNFDKQPHIPEYSDNVALLWHCTRGNIEAVLSQGLDERLGKNGTLGRGIYFADDPMKSMQYDSHGILILFAVYLGDCLQHPHSAKILIREPEKSSGQKRNKSDLFFDSIVGGQACANEYVIFNRFQCCPLYVVSYHRGYTRGMNMGYGVNRGISDILGRSPNSTIQGVTGVTSTSRSGLYIQTRKSPPPFAFLSNHSNRYDNCWPFFAQTIFNLMRRDEKRTTRPTQKLNNNIGAAGGTITCPDLNDTTTTQNLDYDENFLAIQLCSLCDLGFYDLERNRKLLKQFHCNLEKTIDALLIQPETLTPPTNANPEGTDYEYYKAKNFKQPPKLNKPPFRSSQQPISVDDLSLATMPNPNLDRPTFGIRPQRVAAVAAADAALKRAATVPLPALKDGDLEDCLICCVEYLSNNSTAWKTLKCSHKLCVTCYSSIEMTRTTMSGKSETSVKCPFCQVCYGNEIGDCPNGSMKVTNTSTCCIGYEGSQGTLVIDYSVADLKYTLHRRAYLPNSPEGNKVLNLLRNAWDRRLIFRIGNSLVSGRQDVLVWNIHHKTNMNGGVQSYGFPDPTYIQRVLDELKQYGIQ